MSGPNRQDWSPSAYSKFRSLRMRPALDLLQSVPSVGGGMIVDLGCGNGVVGKALKERFGGHSLLGIDASPAMLDAASKLACYDTVLEADVSEWETPEPLGLIFSNAALHWLPKHDVLLPKLVHMLGQGGTLAVQLPHQNNAPSHRVWRSLMDELFPDRYDPSEAPSVLKPAQYHALLSGIGQLSLWETEYYQVLESEPGSHPVRRFTEATYARPFLQALEDDEKADIIERYEAVMEKAYPRDENGRVLFPFRRLFFTLTV